MRSQKASSRPRVRAMASSSGRVALPSRKSSPAFLPSASDDAAVVERVVGQLEGQAEVQAVGAQGRDASARRAPAATAPASAAAANSSAVLAEMISR